MKSTLLFLSFSLVLVYGNPLYAKETPHEARPLQVLRVALKLTEEQATEIRTLLQVRADANDLTSEQIEELQAQLEEILQSDAPDPLDVGEIVLETRTLRQEFGQHQEEFRSAFQSLLTPEQIQRIGQINRIALANRAAEALHKLRLR